VARKVADSQRENKVSEPTRLVDGSRRPADAQVAAFVGRQNSVRWAAVSSFIATHYPGIFNVEWLFGGKKSGWTLRFKKSKSFCTFVPERGLFKLLLVFGAAERQRVDKLLPALVSHVREDYENGTTYHDGRWLFVNVDSAKAVSDIERLLMLKRQPRPKKAAAAKPSRGKRGIA
jgi:hypothetical protein